MGGERTARLQPWRLPHDDLTENHKPLKLKGHKADIAQNGAEPRKSAAMIVLRHVEVCLHSLRCVHRLYEVKNWIQD